jgi:hypothetical protein
VIVQRDLVWDGCVNVRDLGGLPTALGGATKGGQVVRSDNPSRLSDRGWSALSSYGIRTVVALRTIGTEDAEPNQDRIPPHVTVERVFLEDCTDNEFRSRCVDTGFWTTPLQWQEMLRHWPERCAAAVASVARADPGGVLVSCGIGRDRTGLATFLLLALVGVPAEVIADDWSLSIERLADEPEAGGLAALEVLAREQISVVAAIEAALALDVEARLRAGGLSSEDLIAVRKRLAA